MALTSVNVKSSQNWLGSWDRHCLFLGTVIVYSLGAAYPTGITIGVVLVDIRSKVIKSHTIRRPPAGCA